MPAAATAAKQPKVYFLANELDYYRKQIFDAFQKEVGPEVRTELGVYHNSARYFVQLMLKAKVSHSHFAIIPAFYDNPARCHKLINQIPKNRLVLVKNDIEAVTGDYGAVLEDVYSEVIDTLMSIKNHIAKYQRVVLLYPRQEQVSADVVRGVIQFCREAGRPCAALTEISGYNVCKGDLFLVMSDNQLMLLINEIEQQGLKPGSDIGIVSYNENEAKKFILDGLTTVSTDFQAMGAASARMILSGAPQKLSNRFYLTMRKSL